MLRIYFFLPFIFLFLGYAGYVEQSIISGDVIWDKNNSPYYLKYDLEIPYGNSLQIKEGVEVIADSAVAIIVKGDLFATGTANQKIIFRPSSKSCGWGGIRFINVHSSYQDFIKKLESKEIAFSDNFNQLKRKSYDSDYEYQEGSVLLYCEISGGGRYKSSSYVKTATFEGGVVCYNSSPLIENCHFFDCNTYRGAALVTTYYSCPLIRDCLFKNNYSKFGGGAISSSFFSDPVLINNCFLNNSSLGSGGAIFANSSQLTFRGNLFINNSSNKTGGGAFMVNTKTDVIANYFVGNKALVGGSSVASSKSDLSFSKNTFLDTIFPAIYIGDGTDTVYASDNYWIYNLKDSMDVMVFSRKDSYFSSPFRQLSVGKFPALERYKSLYDFGKITLCHDKSYKHPLVGDIYSQFPVYVEVRALGGSPYLKDIVPIYIESKDSNSSGIYLMLQETDLQSGIFRGNIIIDHNKNNDVNVLNAEVGEDISFKMIYDKNSEIVLKLKNNMPYVLSSKVFDKEGRNRIISEKFNFSWNYYDLQNRKQQGYQLQIGLDPKWVKSPIYDSQEITSPDSFLVFSNLNILEKSNQYYYRLRVFNGVRWSLYNSGDFYINGSPDIPVPEYNKIPKVITKKQIITLSCNDVIDEDGDSIKYYFEVSEDSEFRKVFYSQVVDTGVCNIPKEFTENSKYYWRCASSDGYQKSPYAKAGIFYINLKKENPEAVILHSLTSDPEFIINNSSPTFKWNIAKDPDPFSKVVYKLIISENIKFNKLVAETGFSNKEQYHFENKTFSHGKKYYYKVIAEDETKLRSSSKIASFQINTKPSIPHFRNIMFREINKDSTIVFDPSIDPEKGDMISYIIELDSDMGFKKSHKHAFSNSNILVSELPFIERLKDDHIYYMRIHSIDQHKVKSDYSKVWKFVYNKENNKPHYKSVTFSLKDDTLIRKELPILSFIGFDDKDYSDSVETLLYECQLSKKSNFSDIDHSLTSEKGQNNFNFQKIINLKDNCLWFYRVRCQDSKQALSKWTKVRSFIWDRDDEYPQSFQLIKPQGEIASINNITFNWQKALDNDYQDKIEYICVLSKDSLFRDEVFRKRIFDTKFIYKSKLENKIHYYWKVIAVDQKGLETNCSQTFIFIINSTPSIPSILQKNGPLDLKLNSNLTFSKSHDPCTDDKIIYELKIHDLENGQEFVCSPKFKYKKDVITVTLNKCLKKSMLKDDHLFRWQVRAKDNHGCQSEYSDWQEFYLNIKNNTPIIEDIVSPSINIITSHPTVAFKVSAKDRDFSDKDNLGCQIEYSHDRNLLKSSKESFNKLNFDVKFTERKTIYYRLRVFDKNKSYSKWTDIRKIILKD